MNVSFAWMALTAAIASAPFSAAGAQSAEKPSSTAPDEIVVTAEIEQAERDVDQLTQSITRRPRTDKPIARRFGGICVGVHGMSEQFAHVLIQRIEENARSLNVHVLSPGCQVNTLVAFTRNSRAEVLRLRKEEPWLFATLLDYEYERILRGNGAAQSWQSTTVKGADGKEFNALLVGDPPREVMSNTQPFASNISQQLRVDVDGAIVVFDNARVAGKSIQQLADYATMRLFAPTDDVSGGNPVSLDTILSLFADDHVAPDGLTPFDRAYLGALYKLPPTARGEAVSDATWTAYRRAELDAPAEPGSN